jgi:enoyl-CoA hydratase/carnithine racemase
MAWQHINFDVSGAGVATIALNRPDSLNALNAAMLDEIRAAVESLPDSGARALLLTGEGRGFSSGADLASGGGLPEDVLTGFVDGDKAHGRPVGLAVDKSGALLVADDVGNIIWRVTPKQGN